MKTSNLTRFATPSPATWRIDPAASTVDFAVDERMAFVKRCTVIGRFAGITGAIVLVEDDPAASRIEFAIDARSVETGHPRRDKNLRGKHFFDVASCPTITFASRRCDLVDAAAGRYRATGFLTVRGITREIAVEAVCDLSRPATTVSATIELNRRDFRMTWGNPLLWIADDVRVSVALEAVSIPVAKAA